MLFRAKCMLHNMASLASERTPPLARGSARWVALWASERANPLARSAHECEIFGSARLILARSWGSASRLGSLPTLKINLHPQTPLYTVSTSFERVQTPIRCAESDGVVRLDIRTLVVEIWPKTCSISRFSKHPSTECFIYSPNALRDGRYTYSMRWIR